MASTKTYKLWWVPQGINPMGHKRCRIQDMVPSIFNPA
jgi:hemolysin-activating ACP:hemolysin acyltransferase